MKYTRKERRSRTDYLLNKFNDIVENRYLLNSSEDNLNELLDFYEELIPNWVQQFNRFNKNLSRRNSTQVPIFDEFLKVQLPDGYSVKDLKAPENKGNNSFKDIMNRGRIIHLSNKIAHQFDYMFRTEVSDFLKKNQIQPSTPEEFEQIVALMRRVYSPSIPTAKKVYAKENLFSYGFEKADFEPNSYLNKQNLSGLVRGFYDAMFIKDTEIENVNELAQIHDRRDVSYGIKSDDRNNALFVMDVQKFGQFSVHIKNPDLIAKIKQKYEMPIYRRETSVLVDYVSESAKKFIKDSQEDSSMDDERKIPKKIPYAAKQRRRLVAEINFLDIPAAEKHEIGVKAGLIDSNLKRLETDEER
ncbi:MAG: hypothetical protein IKL55_04085 [Clostridia bacterium]|nr:hypothetical protein [Clostridia bacterium]